MLNPTETKIIELMRKARQGRLSAYDEIIFSDDPQKHKQMFEELRWQAEHGPADALVAYYGEEAVKLLTA